jgi:membrane fusion protein, macrolide-specific efflux system
VRGQVTAVAPQSITQSGVTSYLVTIALPSAPGVQPGMTATANVIYAQQADALLVPNRALHRQGRDQAVDVLTKDGTVESRVVTRGISNDQQTAITDGLAEGDQVVIPSTQTRAPTVGGPGAGGLGGLPGAGGRPPGR